MANVRLFKLESALPTEHQPGSDGVALLNVDTNIINELSAGSGVLIDGLQILDGGATFSNTLFMGSFGISSVGSIDFATATGAIAGIENQNLLDKTAVETITAVYEFAGSKIRLPNSTAVVLANVGDIALHVATAGSEWPASIKYHDGSSEFQVVALETNALSAAVDGEILVYDASLSSFKLAPEDVGSVGVLNILTLTNAHGSQINTGDAVFINTSSSVAIADADVAADADGVIGIAVTAATTGASVEIHTNVGRVVSNVLTSTSFAAGDTVFLSRSGTTGSTLTNTAVGAGSVVKLGIAISQQDMLWQPDFRVKLGT